MAPAARTGAPGIDARARSRRRKRVVLVSASLLAALLTVEGGLRFLLFSDLARRSGLGWRARNAALYTAREAGEESWRLKALLQGPRAALPSPNYDARFGWLKPTIDAATLAHADEGLLAGRRPVLLFGDSYAECASAPCWQELLQASELSDRFCLLNYGVGGFGLDQMAMLLGPVLDRFAERSPIVVIGILVDDDLDRCDLGLRGFPKPHFTVRDDQLALHPLEHADPQSYLRDHPLGIRSFAWRWLLFGSGLVPRELALAWVGETGHVARKEELNRLLLLAIRDELEARDLTYFFLLFHARRSLEAAGPHGWQEPFLYATFPELGASFVSSKRFLRSFLERTGTPVEHLYLPPGPGMNHYTSLANEVVFEALSDGLKGRFEPFEYLADR